MMLPIYTRNSPWANGKPGGQTLYGGTGSGDDLTLQSTSHATKGTIFFGAAGTDVYDEVNARWGLGVAAPARVLEVRSTSAQQRMSYSAAIYTDFYTGPSGSLTITNTGDRILHSLSGNAGLAEIYNPATGEGAAGVWLIANGLLSYKNLVLGPSSSGTAGNSLQLAYYNQTSWYAALEIANVASGYGNLKLMKSGGVVGIGMGATTPARALEVRSTSAQQRWSYDASNYAEIAVSSAGAVTLTATGASDGFCIGDSGDNIGFYGVTPVTRPAAYTQTYSTADRTLSAYTADNESVAYTGAADGEAQLADLNALRVAYENLRAFVEDLAQHHNSVVDDLQAVGLLQ